MDHLLRISILGETGIGKTSLMSRYVVNYKKKEKIIQKYYTKNNLKDDEFRQGLHFITVI